MDQSEVQAMQVALANFLRAAIKILGTRVLTWAAMLITAGMFGYALWAPDLIRLATATIFAVLVFWRVTAIDRSNGSE